MKNEGFPFIHSLFIHHPPLYVIYSIFTRFLLVGDFNIHVCCQSNSLSQEFCDLIDAFNLLQWVKNSTHIQGHTLDLVLSHGIDVTDIILSDFLLSDHKPILFSLSLPELSQPTVAPVMLRVYSPQFSTNFDLCFANVTAPLKPQPHKPKPKSDLWQNS